MKPIATLIPILMLALAGCGGPDTEKSAATPASATRVAVMPVKAGAWPRSIEGMGTVEARAESVIAARAMGYIEAIRVREGDRVSAGQTLVEISARELHASADQAKAARHEARSARAEADGAVAAAEAQAVLARTTHQRMTNLHDRKSISDQEFDEASARLAAAEASLQMARARQMQVAEKIAQAAAGVAAAESQLSYLRISAPFAGVVTARMAEPGDLASPGMPLLKLEQAGNYRLVAAFPESALREVKPGRKIPVEIAAIGLAGEGTVAEIVPVLDPQTRTFPVKIALPASGLVRSGLFGVARLAGAGVETISVPVTAVRINGQLTTVFVAEGGKAHLRMVQLGETRDGRREVLAGLGAGELLIPEPAAGLRDGDAVEVSQ